MARKVLAAKKKGTSTRAADAPAKKAGAKAAAPSSVVVRAPAFSVHAPAESAAERNLKCLFFGEVGVGKTTLGASAREVKSMQDVLFIDAEAGELSLAGMRSLDVITISTYKALARIFDWLHLQVAAKGDEARLLELQKPFIGDGRVRHYKTVVIDSLSEVQKYLMYQLLGIDIGKAKLDSEPETAQQRDWLASADMIRLLVRSFRDLPMHVIFICAEEPNDLGKLEPKLPGKLSGEVPGFMDIVGYLAKVKGKDEDTRRLHLAAGNKKWKSKHRFRNLPDLNYLEDPTMEGLLALDRKDATATNGNPNPATTTKRKQAGEGQAARRGGAVRRRRRG